MTFTLVKKQFKVSNNQAYWDNQVIDLSDKGHACLILFLQSRHEIITKDSIIKALWGQLVVSDDSVFKVIQEVRKALKQIGFSKNMIGNVYGKGYQWLENEPAISNNKKLWYQKIAFPVTLALIILGIYALVMNKPKLPSISKIEFSALVQKLKKGEALNLSETFSVKENNAHPIDLLRLAYLQAYNDYQSGAYQPSIDTLQQGITAYGNGQSVPVLADSYLLLSKMFMYRDDKSTLKSYLEQASHHFKTLNDDQGMIDAQIETARYHQAIFEYPTSIEQLNEILQQAKKSNNTQVIMRSLVNLAHSYNQTQQPEKAITALEETLEMALSVADGDFAAYAHGALSTVAMETLNYSKAMKYAQAALQFSLTQHNTNKFQQSFSAFYLLLLPMGHVELADKYLESAINLQHHFNPEGVLYLAELQRIQSLSQQHKHRQSRSLVKKLMSETLEHIEAQELQALLAYNSHFLKDNINAYTQSKPIFEDPKATDIARVYAGIAFVLSADQLERTEEASQAFLNLKKIIPEQNNILNSAYFDLLNRIPGEWINTIETQKKREKFDQNIIHIKTTTAPKAEMLNKLDDYIDDIISN